jgi:hypothetical protein
VIFAFSVRQNNFATDSGVKQTCGGANLCWAAAALLRVIRESGLSDPHGGSGPTGGPVHPHPRWIGQAEAPQVLNGEF